MYEKYVVSFFKSMGFYNEEYFNILKNNSKIINMPYEEIKDLVGCYLTNDGCKLILPKINNIFDVLIWIHEYSHALFPEDELEFFPNIMEAIFINNYIKDNKVKEELINKTKYEISVSESISHISGKKVKLILIGGI